MSDIKRKTIKLAVTDSSGGANVDGTNANSSFISNPIKMPIGKKWSLHCWFDGAFSVTGKEPEFTIFLSNTSDANGSLPLADAENITAPEIVTKDDFEGEYMVITYDANGTTAGLKYFFLYVEQDD